jgi:hypothetical protein
MPGNTRAFAISLEHHMPRTHIPQAHGRNWCFTVNNPTTEDDNTLDFTKWPTAPIFAVYNLETGENGTPHYQGYLELPHSKTLQWMKHRVPRAHWENRRGTREAAIIYCLKEKQSQQIQHNSDTSSGQHSGQHTGTEEQNSGFIQDYLQETINNLFPVLFNYSSDWLTLLQECTETINNKLTRKQALQKMKTMIQEGASDEDLANFHFSTFLQ